MYLTCYTCLYENTNNLQVFNYDYFLKFLCHIDILYLQHHLYNYLLTFRVMYNNFVNLCLCEMSYKRSLVIINNLGINSFCGI